MHNSLALGKIPKVFYDYYSEYYSYKKFCTYMLYMYKYIFEPELKY